MHVWLLLKDLEEETNLYTNGERVRACVCMCVCVLLIFPQGSRNRRKLIFALQGTLIP